MEFNVTKCSECSRSRHYYTGPYARNPHYCCELMFWLFNEDYKVDPDTVDKNCPYKNEKFVAGIDEIHKSMFGE